MVRQALATLLSLEDDIDVVAQVSRGDQVLEAARRSQAEVALLDIEMPGGDGLTVAGQLRANLPELKVIMLTTFGRPGYLRRAMESGAVGFLLKDAPASELAAAVRGARIGRRTVDPALAAAALSDGSDPLTEREHEILEAARDQPTIAQMAATLHLSPGTVRNHLSVVIGKLGARNRVDAVRIALEKGWLSAG